MEFVIDFNLHIDISFLIGQLKHMGLGYLNEYNLQELTKLLAKLLLDDGPGAT